MVAGSWLDHPIPAYAVTTHVFAQDSSLHSARSSSSSSLIVNRHLQRIETFCSADSCLVPPSASCSSHALFSEEETGACKEKAAGQRICVHLTIPRPCHLWNPALPAQVWTTNSSTSSLKQLRSWEWSPPEEPSRSRLDEWFLPGHRQVPRQRSWPFFPEVHDEITKSWRAAILPYPLHSPPLATPKTRAITNCLL
ncbi:hypothetical protein Q8A67_023434 [Cirrhinus molitorella]|uniref:Uncharacterized protein n=1 Tax=Cirrhinus molitorella TaxID=172907 RepID=A0AA88TCK4_9TELE|nr:hypothetical protein Q8A67_023434 [Cirrhinus molitorella]